MDHRRRRTIGNILMHWVPFVLSIIAVLAIAAVGKHNEDVRNADQKQATLERCKIFKDAVQANRQTIVELIEGAFQPLVPPADISESDRERYDQYNRQQQIRKQQLIAGVNDDPLPDCSNST